MIRRVVHQIKRKMKMVKLMHARAKHIKAYLSSNDLAKLHIGSGGKAFDGWLNVDLRPLRNEIYLDATVRFPLPDSSFDYIFSEHMIEHISFGEGLSMLSECFRIIKPGGKVRIATPDLAFLISLYGPDKSKIQQRYINWAVSEFCPSALSTKDTYVINNFFKNWGHAFIYDEEVLKCALENAGFIDIESVKLGESADKYLRNLENVSRIPEGFLELETIVLEARRPGDIA